MSDVESKTKSQQSLRTRAGLSERAFMRAIVFIILGAVSVAAVLTQDEEMVKYVLGGSATLGVIFYFFG